jgi:hypothetical protein
MASAAAAIWLRLNLDWRVPGSGRARAPALPGHVPDMRYILFPAQRRYIVLAEQRSRMMQTKIRQLHRMLVDRVAESGRLQRAERAAQHGPPGVAAGWQSRIARLTGLGVDSEGPAR